MVDEVEVPQDINEDIAEIENDIGGEGIAIDDPVRMYLKEIGKVQLLSAQEEIDLAKRMAEGDQEAKQKLAEATFGWWCPWPSVMWAGACSFWI